MGFELTNYLLSAMLTFAPVEQHRHFNPNNSYEDQDASNLARYQSIAEDVETVVYEEEPIFKGPAGNVQTAVLLLAIGSFESGGYRADIDNMTKKGDKGFSKCFLQVWVRQGESLKNRKDCVRLAISRIKESFHSCPFLNKENRLAIYTSGSCDCGRIASRTRFNRAINWMKEHEFFILDNRNPSLFEIIF